MMWSMLVGTLSLLLPRIEGFSVWQQRGRRGFCASELAAGIRKGGKAELYPSERKDLYKSEGSRALTKSEQKAKDQYEASREPFVNRLVPQNCASREPFTHLQAGQKFRGRIISVKGFGMFVDIGSQKDGLVHVKDVSKDYFIQNLASKFSPGQDVDVWVKFCDDKEMKLGLQMFPVTRSSTSAVAAPGPREAAEIIQALSVGQPVSGTVVRVSNYGVYVDVGAGVDAYLHKRKMKMGRKMMKLLPWEISPIGSSVEGWVHEVSHMRGRVSITTYNPSVWGEMLPAPAQGRLDSEDEAVQKEDDEDEDEDEDGIEEDDDGRDAVTRTLALSLDDEEREEDSVGGERSVQLSVSDLSPKELRALEQKRAGRVGAAVVMDDFGSGKRGKEMKTAAKNSNSPERVDASLAGEEISTSELFAQISYNRPTIGLKDIKQWDYMKSLLQTEVITDAQIKQLIGIHGEAGRISEEQFEGFLEMLCDGLDLGQNGEDGEDDEDDEDEEEVGEEEGGGKDKDREFEAQADDSDRLAVLMDDTQDIEPSSVLPGDYHEDIRDDQELSMGSAFSPSSLQAAITPIPPAGGLSALSGKKPKSNDLFQYVFASVAGKKGYVTATDVIGWDFARALISQGGITELACIEMFERIVKKVQVKVRGPALGEVRASADAFDVFVGELANIQGNPSSPPPEEVLAADDEGEEMSLDDCFAALSGGKDTVSEMAVLKWDVVQELVQAGAVSRETFGELWRKAGQQGRKSLTIDGFEKLLDLLAPFAEEQDELMDNVRVSGSPSTAASAQVKPVSKNRGGAAEVGEEEDEVIMGEEEGDYFDVDLEEEFMQLADGRKTIKFSDLQRWELVKQMRAVGLMDDAELRDVCDSAGVGNLDKIDVFDFEGICEELSNRSGEDDEEEEV